jgi:ABC-2 type transport system permease protein
LRSREQHRRAAPRRPLLVKELREVACGRALWIMLLLTCPLVGYSFFQAVSLYAEASAAGQQSPVLAGSLSPLDGVLVPTFGTLYVCVTLLFPFVAIRVVSHEKETGALLLLAQLPYASATLVGAKLAAVMTAWLLVSVPALSALAVWVMLGGHLSPAETLNLLLGHLLYGLLVGAAALFAAALAEGAATAAIITLACTIGSWVLDFTVAGRPGLFDWMARLSLTQALRGFEQGLFSAGTALGMAAAAAGFAGLACIWLRPGVLPRVRLVRSAAWVLAATAAVGVAAQLRWSADVSEDQRNSFPAADQRLLARLAAPLTITVHLTPEDPRFTDLQRNVLTKLERAMPRVTVQLAGGGGERDPRYGEVEYVYGGRTDMSRSTSPREVLPLIYSLAGAPLPTPAPGGDYPGYPLVASGDGALVWFLGVLPLLIAFAWGWSRRPPSLDRLLAKEVRHATE